MNRRKFLKSLPALGVLPLMGLSDSSGGPNKTNDEWVVKNTGRRDDCDVHVMIRIQDNRDGQVYCAGSKFDEGPNQIRVAVAMDAHRKWLKKLLTTE